MFGKSLDLHPIIVLLALTFWYVVVFVVVFVYTSAKSNTKYLTLEHTHRYAIWGVTGAILAVPITAVIRITVTETNHPYAKFIQNILEGRLPSNWSKSLATRRRESELHEV